VTDSHTTTVDSTTTTPVSTLDNARKAVLMPSRVRSLLSQALFRRSCYDGQTTSPAGTSTPPVTFEICSHRTAARTVADIFTGPYQTPCGT